MNHNLTYKKFGDVASFSRGLTFAKGDVAIGSSKKVLRSNNIDLQTHTLNFDDVACLKEEFIIPNEKKLHKGDIFICMSNGSTQHLGKVAFIDKDMDYAFGGFMGVIHPDNTTIYPKYAFYACLSSEYRRFLASIINGININNLKWSDLSNLQIPIPTLQEQERIVAELDLLTGIIDKQKQQLKELDTLAQSIFYDMFGNPQTDERGWNMEKLSSICVSISDGSHNPPKGGKKSDYLMLSSKNIKDGVLSLEEPRYLSKDEFSLENKRTNVKKGDILLTIVGTIGRCCLFDSSKNIVFQRSVAILKPNDTTNNLFLMYQMIMLRMVFENEAKGVAQKGIYLRQLGNIMVIVPPKGLQDSFAQKIQAIESQKESINRSIAESQKLFDYTMDKYFG